MDYFDRQLILYFDFYGVFVDLFVFDDIWQNGYEGVDIMCFEIISYECLIEIGLDQWSF